MAHVVIGRTLTIAAGVLLLGPPLMVGAVGLGLPPLVAWTVPVGLAIAATLSGRVPPLPIAAARAHPVVALLWTAALVVAVAFSVRTSLYAHFPEARQLSVAPGDTFREDHLCMTAYFEAARFATAADAKVYDRELYRPGAVPRRLGHFTVDYYHYPPPFLLVPTALRTVAPDFYDFRRVWFALQATTMVALWVSMAWWIGGATGRRFALAGVVLMALPVSWASLQVGNVQSTVIALALAGAMAAASGRPAPAAALLVAVTLGKIFPGVLLAHVVAWRRPRFAAWALAWGLGLTAVTATLLGVAIFGEFVFVELPRMLSGESFPQTELPFAIVVNQSIYGFTTKLRLLGLDMLDREAGKAVTRGLVALGGLAALAVGWRVVAPARIDSSDQRLAVLAIAFGFLNLASLISPFVGGAYGALYTIWLAALIGVSTLPGRLRAAVLAAAAVLLVTNSLTSSPRAGVVPATTTLFWATVGGGLLLALNAGAIALGVRQLRAPIRTEAARSTQSIDVRPTG